jgi:hypothetical protein
MSSRPAPVTRKSAKSEYIETVSANSCPSHRSIWETTNGCVYFRVEICVSRTWTKFDTQDTGNKISRKAKIEGKPNIMLGGRTVIMADVYMRGDLHRFSSSGEGGAAQPTTAISIGRYGFHPSCSNSHLGFWQRNRYTVVATGCTLKPPSRISRGQMAYYPMRIGDNVFIGRSHLPRYGKSTKLIIQRTQLPHLGHCDQFSRLHRRQCCTQPILYHQG